MRPVTVDNLVQVFAGDFRLAGIDGEGRDAAEQNQRPARRGDRGGGEVIGISPGCRVEFHADADFLQLANQLRDDGAGELGVQAGGNSGGVETTHGGAYGADVDVIGIAGGYNSGYDRIHALNFADGSGHTVGRRCRCCRVDR
jgi:hypothetical protein